MNSVILAADVNFMIKGIFSYQIFGQTVWITTTHVCLLIVLLLTLALVFKRIDRLQKEKEGADAAIEDALQEGEEDSENFLSEREEQILPLIAAGYTSPQIAEKVYLSLPTIKWYRKRLLEKFDAANTAELISKAKEKSLI